MSKERLIRKIDTDSVHNVNTEKITDLPFDDIIGHSESVRKYFTIENNNIIYSRLNNVVKIAYLPYLGPAVDFGAGDICLEENGDIFKFYTVDRIAKFDYEEFSDIKSAIDKLVSFYGEFKYVDDPEKMRTIFYETFGLEKPMQKNFCPQD